ncbi:MAG: MMPL family transporter [Alphaproteobacteria bacterium]|nr:MMPL family transporter [Alphaproteobacteria bacterium]MBV9153589.1 MMPL family transporter [Alphaproteobacteria bacterium]MBV9587566.1 MMPL family transporter [Alphaproteobacteria bacterium]
MIAAIVAHIVEFARRRAVFVVAACIVLSAVAAVYAATHLAVDTDIERMLPSNVAWRQNEKALDDAFPQNISLLVVVIDGRTPDLAEQAASELAEKMRAEPRLFTHVRQPDGGPFFDRNGLLFLSTAELEKVSAQLIAAQPLIGSLAHDPSLRGLFDALATFVSGAGSDSSAVAQLDPTLTMIRNVVQGILDGKPQSLSWTQLMTGREATVRDLRRFIVTRPVLDFSGLEPGAAASAEIRRLAGELGINAENGARVRLTGPVALDDEQFATLREGALRSTALSVVMVCVILFVALRSVKLVGAIIVTLTAGSLLTAGFAALAIGSLNLISIAFGVLFIGLAVDFSIQFSIRYRDQRYRLGAFPDALHGTALTIGPSLVLAAGATAIGFLSFVPTRYTGIQALGWIAGTGMIIAIALNFLLLPALLALMRPHGEPEPIGFRRAAPLDDWLIGHRLWVIGAAALLAAGSAALLPYVTFDFDPLNLKNPRTESVSTARDLMNDPMTSPYTAEILAPSLEDAKALAERLGKLPEVAQVVTAAAFIPEDQDKKLPIIEDVAVLLGPSLNDPQPLPPPSDEEVLKAMQACADKLQAAAKPGSPGSYLAVALHAAAARGSSIVAPLREGLVAGLLRRLNGLRQMTKAKPLTLDNLPPGLREGWITPDGRARIEVFPRGDARDHRVLEDFVAAVHSVAPDATGTPVTIQEAGRLISKAFVDAGVVGIAAITILLGVVLRRLREMLMVIAPLLLAALLTLAVTVVIGRPLNYANIIALPLLLGIGVAFDIYFVMNWRAGLTHHLQSSTARAVLFSALTTLSAFGSLALSNDPATAGMGELLTISLACTLLCTFIVLPALLGPARITNMETDQREAAG